MLGEIIRNRSITEVLHFTTQRGLVGMLAEGEVLSRRLLPANKYLENVAFANAKFRPEESVHFDKSKDWLDYINLSISEINRSFFDISKRWHKDEDVWWVILSFDAIILEHEGVFFGTTNNKYDGCERGAGPTGLAKLFAKIIHREGNWWARRAGRADHLTTCQQAEVLYPSRLSLASLRRIYVSEDEQSDMVKSMLRMLDRTDVEVVIRPKKFEGMPN
ncbi:DUF4433 domain-containing protein [Brevundimonas sp. S30B]|uniref:DarT ssDNA thymidine ADP-ribosyltransferase family protein n=1 Tax=unclassified Brevundimonas TaxID=2622653 RepID=UPI0010724939|nr:MULTISPECIES: DarT ssDNA thymidine ADP-ribosyltransferase family protein [unclassified Brevundimonas]QBX36298.1 DUF4433 domain-containing protein [Brevundimonas sp. MF30-B]TFW01006.1 DUF4433 domain-containing protein [Brevundimonas sp. S30B]